MRRDPTEFRARFNAYKNGQMPYDAGLPKFAEGTGGVENNITEEYAPIVSDTYQSTVNKLKQQTAAFNVDDYVYVAKKLHPEITKEQVMNVYNNTPYVASDSSRGSTLGLYRHGEDDGYGRGITIYPRRMRPDGPDFNLEDRIKSNIFHESHHLFRDMLFGGKYTDEESKYLRLAIPDAINDNERAARIGEGRGNLNIQTGATGKKLDDAVDKMSSKEAKFHYSKLNSSEANTSGWNPQIEDAFRWALKNIASTQIRPRQGLLQAKDGKLPEYGDGKTPKDKRARAMYNAIDPRDAYPETYADAARREIKVRHKMYFGDPDKMEYEVGEDIPSRVSDAAWRKRLGYDYDESLLIPNGNSVRLPVELEQEIPTDTTMLKNRINRTKELMQYSRKYRRDPYIKEALQRDQEALDALRYTYKTGKPVTINEHSNNSRQWVSGGEVSPTMSPLNVLQNYTVQYNPQDNTMLYRDIYDFNQFEWAIPGKPFTIEGKLVLPKR